MTRRLHQYYNILVQQNLLSYGDKNTHLPKGQKRNLTSIQEFLRPIISIFPMSFIM